MNNCPFGRKFMEAKLLLNLNLIYLRSKMFKKSDKFPKNLARLDLPEYEFRLAWLYGKICSFHPSPYDLV
jgi:hypothetical protein